MAISSEEIVYTEDFDYGLTSKIFKSAMGSKWAEVCYIFEKNKQVRMENITRDNNTVLHVAISAATENIVLKLLRIIENTNSEDECKKIFGAQNRSGDTPLHLAVAFGLDEVCHKIAGLMPEMVTTARNKRGETPLFTAVRYGNKTAFFALEASIHDHEHRDDTIGGSSTRDLSHCREYDGDTILHCAIKGEHLDLANEIIHLYPRLVSYVNSRGESALHALANKPSVFKSGARFGFYDRILYHFVTAKPLKLQFNDWKKHLAVPRELPKDVDVDLPPTYKACINLLFLTKKLIDCIFKTVASSWRTGTCKRCYSDDPESQSEAQKEDEYEASKNQKQRRQIPQNYDVAFSILKIVKKLLFIFLRIVSRRVQAIGKLKQKHRYAMTIMEELVERSNYWETGGMEPSDLSDRLFRLHSQRFFGIDREENQQISSEVSASPVLIAAKMGIWEMVKSILEQFPVAILDKDKDEKNIVLLAVEHRQLQVYRNISLFVSTMRENVFGKLDKKGNSALHLAAMLTDNHPRSNSGAVLQMQWESKWFKYVNDSIRPEIIAEVSKVNHEGKTAQQIFTESHEKLVKKGREWLINTSQSCSLVAVLIATVAFASASDVPGGPKQDSGYPILGQTPYFQAFTISSLVALCSSVTSLIMFLTILTSLYQITDYERALPMKLIVGLTTLCLSIAASLVAFCAGDFFVAEGDIKWAAYPMYIFMCFPVTYFAIAQFPLYSRLVQTSIKLGSY